MKFSGLGILGLWDMPMVVYFNVPGLDHVYSSSTSRTAKC